LNNFVCPGSLNGGIVIFLLAWFLHFFLIWNLIVNELCKFFSFLFFSFSLLW
jgi:hypothetical protein